MQKTSTIDNFTQILDDIKSSSFDVIYIASDMFGLGLMHGNRDPKSVVEKVSEMLFEQLQDKTVIFPTASLNFCNNLEIFDAKNTPSKHMGVLNEILRINYAEYRSAHPFWSHAGWGPHIPTLLKSVSANAYGVDSIWDRLLNFNVLTLNIGIDIRRAMTVVHHLEQIQGVPYRFSKAFYRTIKTFENEDESRIFTINVIRKNLHLVRDKNEKLCYGFNPYLIQKEFSDIQTYIYKDFYEHLKNKIAKDIFIWVKNADEVRNYCLDIKD